jgi:uncharacterized protein (DUF111 family)
LVATRIGYGLGGREHSTRPNVLRAALGETVAETASAAEVAAADAVGLDWERELVTVLETNLDDSPAEVLGHFLELALAAGALEVFYTAIQMKKNRPGVLLTVLCPAAEADKFSELILRETSAFGVRRYAAERRKLRRSFITVKTRYGEVTVKLGRLGGRIVQAAPEFESCKSLAARTGIPLRQIYEAALAAATPD